MNVSPFVHVSPVMKSVVGQIIIKLAKEHYILAIITNNNNNNVTVFTYLYPVNR